MCGKEHKGAPWSRHTVRWFGGGLSNLNMSFTDGQRGSAACFASVGIPKRSAKVVRVKLGVERPARPAAHVHKVLGAALPAD